MHDAAQGHARGRQQSLPLLRGAADLEKSIRAYRSMTLELATPYAERWLASQEKIA
jgi:hypothetical protein